MAMSCIYTTQLPLSFNPIGEHQTFVLDKDVIYTVFYPFEIKEDTPQRVRVQFTNDVWVRLDGGTPDVNVGFLIQTGEPKDWFIQVGDGLVKLITKFPNTVLQAQWLGFPME